MGFIFISLQLFIYFCIIILFIIDLLVYHVCVRITIFFSRFINHLVYIKINNIPQLSEDHIVFELLFNQV